ncbi:MAG TPA: MFS transporter [Alphaproteobacteria bacterium]|jgi:MFS family permease
MTATAEGLRQDTKIMSLVCTGHFLSHFYAFCLPPLFPFLNADLGISYTALGALLSLRGLATSVAQLPAGFVVDRFGAKMVLLAGLMMTVLGYALFAAVDIYWLFVVFIVLGGVGDSVFHPADYSILNASVDQSRMGRAFSIHTFSGHLGFAVAPTVVTVLAAFWNWRIALLVVSLFGIIVAAMLASQWHAMKDDAEKPSKQAVAAPDPNAPKQSWFQAKLGMIFNAPVMSLFGFFVISTMATNGISGFSISALTHMHDIPEAALGLSVTGFMLASAFAVLAGGYVADKLPVSASVFAGLGFLCAAVIVLSIGLFDLPYALMILLFPLAGFFLGVIRPARDLMVRDVAPKGQSGKVFGFVFSGQSLGGSIAPVIYGYILDHYAAPTVFYVSAGFLALGVFTVISTASVRDHAKA